VQDVYESAVPSPSLVEHSLASIDFSDAFAVDLPHGAFAQVDDLARACATFPRWVEFMMSLRNGIMRWFGVVTKAPADYVSTSSAAIVPGGYVGIFKVLSRDNDEILMGMDDKHLDFRFSLLLRQRGESQHAVATTAVRYRNVWGRLYFAVVKPFHRLIVPSWLRHGLARTPRAS
jgi:hypothetical protein